MRSMANSDFCPTGRSGRTKGRNDETGSRSSGDDRRHDVRRWTGTSEHLQLELHAITDPLAYDFSDHDPTANHATPDQLHEHDATPNDTPEHGEPHGSRQLGNVIDPTGTSLSQHHPNGFHGSF